MREAPTPLSEAKTKLCVACGHTWDINAFYANRRSADGRQAFCRSCQGIYTARHPKPERKAPRKPFNSAPEGVKKAIKSPRGEAYLQIQEADTRAKGPGLRARAQQLDLFSEDMTSIVEEAVKATLAKLGGAK